MTLHEAILKVLFDHGAPMTTQEIAAVINTNKLYIRKDENPLPTEQFHSRISNHPELFIKQDGTTAIHPNYNIATIRRRTYVRS